MNLYREQNADKTPIGADKVPISADKTLLANEKKGNGVSAIQSGYYK